MSDQSRSRRRGAADREALAGERLRAFSAESKRTAVGEATVMGSCECGGLRRAADGGSEPETQAEHLRSLVARNLELIDLAKRSDEEGVRAAAERKRNDRTIALLCLERRRSGYLGSVDEYGTTLLHVACALEDASMAEILLKGQSNPNARLRTDSPLAPGYTPLHFAAHFNLQTVGLLQAHGGNILAEDTNGLSPLEICMSRWRPDQVRSLLEEDVRLRDILLSDGSTKLLDLVSAMRSVDEFDAFLAKLSDVNLTVDENSPIFPGCTALHMAVMTNEEACRGSSVESRSDAYLGRIGKCLIRGADLNTQAANGWTAVHVAFRQKRRTVVELLLACCACEPLRNPMDSNGLSHFHMACAAGGKETVQRFFHVDAEDVALQFVLINVDVNAQVKAPFDWYVRSRDRREEPELRRIAVGATPLHIAVLLRDLDLVEYLLRNEANLYAEDLYRLTPAHYIMSHSRKDAAAMAEVLLSSEDLRLCVVDNFGLSLLHVACFARYYSAVEKLALRNAQDLDVPIADVVFPREVAFLARFAGCTPLRIAMDGRETLGCLDWSLVRRGASIHVPEPPGPSILHFILRDAPRYRDTKAVLANLKRQRLGSGAIDDTGLTMLHFACASLDEPFARQLISRGAKVEARIVDDCGYRWAGFTPLHLLIDAYGSSIEQRSGCRFHGKVDILSMINLLSRHGANVDVQNADGATPVHMMFRAYGNAKRENRTAHLLLGQLLCRSDFSINPVDEFGLSHFHLACMYEEHVELVKEYLSFCGDFCLNAPTDLDAPEYPSARYEPGYTALHFALSYNCTNIVRLLLERGANVRVKDRAGNTPLHIAQKYNFTNLDAVEFMISRGADLTARDERGETPFGSDSERIPVDRVAPFSRTEFFLEIFRELGYLAMEGLRATASGIRCVLLMFSSSVTRRPREEPCDL